MSLGKEARMKTVCLVALVAALAVGTADAKNAQQERMKACNAQASGKSGADRDAFMKECLRTDATSQQGVKSSQQQKMKDCNKEAGDRKGADRRAFMSECLKNH